MYLVIVIDTPHQNFASYIYITNYTSLRQHSPFNVLLYGAVVVSKIESEHLSVSFPVLWKIEIPCALLRCFLHQNRIFLTALMLMIPSISSITCLHNSCLFCFSHKISIKSCTYSYMACLVCCNIPFVCTYEYNVC